MTQPPKREETKGDREKMKKRLLVIGGVAAGPKAAAKARRCDPEMEIVVYQEEDDISYAGCGLPYYISGVSKTGKS